MKPIARLSANALACVPAMWPLRPEAAILLTGILAVAPNLSFAAGKDIFVDAAQGSDQGVCGTQARPCNSISHAITFYSQPDDHIYLAGNTDFPVTAVHLFHNLSFHGTGATVLDANSNDRHFLIDSGATVTLQDMVLKNGLSAGNGGSIHLSSGDLRLRNVIFENNEAPYGGALWIEDGTLLSEGSEFTNNRAVPNDGGAIYCSSYVPNSSSSLEIFDTSFNLNSAQREGGGIKTNCATTVRRSDFFDNSANHGGAIQSYMPDDAVFEVRRSQFSRNTADGSGGAISAEGGTTDIRRSSFNENSAFDGGGISYMVTNAIALEDLTVVNSTFSSNTASNEGGAIVGTSGELHFVTMVDNWADTERGLDIKSYGAVQGAIGIYNSLINHNPDTIDPGAALLCHGNIDFSVGDGNLMDNDSCGINVVVVGTHPYGSLFDLRLNGGRTLSHGLRGFSSALDAALGCNGPNGTNNVDQRGYPRPESGGADCDIGSFERE